jgi:hypothetical protein
MFDQYGSSGQRKFQLITNGEYFDSFNSFHEAIYAGRNFNSIKIVDSYDSLVVFENQVSLPSPAVGKA